MKGKAPRGFEPSFWRLWYATAVSGLGDGARLAALPLLAVTITRDPVLISLVTVGGQLPWLVVGPVTGALTDRVDRRRAILGTAVFQAAAMAAFVIAVAAGVTSIPLLAALAFALTTAQTLGTNAAAALVPELVGRRSLESANGLLQASQFVTTEFLGVLLGVVLFGFAVTLPFTVDAVSFAVAALLVMGIRSAPAGDRPARRPLRAEIVEGMHWLLRHPLLRTVCLLSGLANFAVTGMLGIAVLYALDVLGVNRVGYGLLLSVVAAGALVGLAVAPVLSARMGRGGTLQLTFGLCPLSFLVTGLTSRPLVAASAFFFVGASISIGNVVTMSMRQSLVPRGLFGRVNSFYRLVGLGFSPLGGLAGGVLAAQFGLRAPFVFGAVVLAIGVGFALPRLSNRALALAEVDGTRPRAERV